MDLESQPWPFPPGRFDGVVVTNYLHRPLFQDLAGALKEGGVLVYETFMRGQERLGRPSNPAFLLEPGELLTAFGGLQVIAFEQGLLASRVVQRLCAIRGTGPVSLELE